MQVSVPHMEQLQTLLKVSETFVKRGAASASRHVDEIRKRRSIYLLIHGEPPCVLHGSRALVHVSVRMSLQLGVKQPESEEAQPASRFYYAANDALRLRMPLRQLVLQQLSIQSG